MRSRLCCLCWWRAMGARANKHARAVKTEDEQRIKHDNKKRERHTRHAAMAVSVARQMRRSMVRGPAPSATRVLAVDPARAQRKRRPGAGTHVTAARALALCRAQESIKATLAPLSFFSQGSTDKNSNPRRHCSCLVLEPRCAHISQRGRAQHVDAKGERQKKEEPVRSLPPTARSPRINSKMAQYDQSSQLPQQQQQQQQQCLHSSPRPLLSEDGGRDVEGAVRHGSGDVDVMHLVGPPLWETMHYAAFQCPEPFVERAPALLDLVRAYAALLPCAECRGHFAALLAAHPPEEAARAGRQAFARWTVDAHNMVNARLGKPLVTFEQAAWRYARGDLCCRDSAAGRRAPDSLAKRVLPAVVVAVALVALVVAGVWLYYTRARGPQSTDRAQRVQQESAKG